VPFGSGTLETSIFGASGISGVFSVENSVRAREAHWPTKQLDEVYED